MRAMKQQGWRGLGVLLNLLLVQGCGARSSAGSWQGSPGGGTPAEAGVPVRDAAPPVRDGAVTLRDSCLRLPASEVQGRYTGDWKGTWSCPENQPVGVNGDLHFVLVPAGEPDTFDVRGEMRGTVLSGNAFFGTIEGSMGCTALSAELPEIIIGWDEGLRLTGRMQAECVPKSSG